MDDVVNVSGHRLGTAEVESALVSHPAVAEAAVVSRPDELTGSAIVAFVTLRVGREADEGLAHDSLQRDLAEHVAREIGKIARPAEIHLAAALPKTRSGKIMRRLLRDIARGNNPAGDLSTLEDPEVLRKLQHTED
jgi:acetyl-CoA synthetase